MTTRAINGSANTVTWAFDSLGRVTSEASVLGTFTYTYDGPTGRVATVTYPNSQTSEYSYLPTNADHRLQTIHHKYPGGATLSKFDYTHDGVGNIRTWRQQADTSAVRWEYGYDAADQLVGAVKTSTDPTPVILQRYAYAYDPAGNRTAEQIDDVVTGASHDSLNRLVSHQPAGLLTFAGTVSEPAAVTVPGVPAVVGGNNAFRVSVPVASGANPVTITATDASGNVATKQYEVSQSGSGKTFTYDANSSADVYRELSIKTPATVVPAGFVAENPDHANLAADNRKQADELGKFRIQMAGQQNRLSTLEATNKSLESERDSLKAQLDDRHQRKAIRDNLSKLLDEGGRILAIVANQNQEVPSAQINDWVQRLEKYLASVSTTYVTRSRNGSGVPMGGLRTANPPGAVRLQAYGIMHVRLFRLEEFIKELG